MIYLTVWLAKSYKTYIKNNLIAENVKEQTKLIAAGYASYW